MRATPKSTPNHRHSNGQQNRPHSRDVPSNHEVTDKHTTKGRQFKNSASSSQLPSSINLARTYRYRFPDVKTFHDIGELLHEAYANIGHLNNSTIAAFWSHIPALLEQQQHHPLNVLEQTKQLFHIIQRTMESMKQFWPQDISTIILGMARILKYVREAKGKRKDGAYHNMFALALGVDKLTSSDGIFQCLAKAANRIISEFNPRCISNLVYAYALGSMTEERCWKMLPPLQLGSCMASTRKILQTLCGLLQPWKCLEQIFPVSSITGCSRRLVTLLYVET
jgi:hypothetical protein